MSDVRLWLVFQHLVMYIYTFSILIFISSLLSRTQRQNLFLQSFKGDYSTVNSSLDGLPLRSVHLCRDTVYCREASRCLVYVFVTRVFGYYLDFYRIVITVPSTVL